MTPGQHITISLSMLATGLIGCMAIAITIAMKGPAAVVDVLALPSGLLTFTGLVLTFIVMLKDISRG